MATRNAQRELVPKPTSGAGSHGRNVRSDLTSRAIAIGALVLLIVSVTTVAAQTTNAGHVEFATKSLPSAVLGTEYNQKLQLTGGQGAFEWSLAGGSLPPGLKFDREAGVISGKPSEQGTFQFVVAAQDLTTKAVIKREFAITVSGALLLNWIDPPKVSEQSVSGKVEVINALGENVNLTILVEAVNEIGKAFVLGYEHVDFATQGKREVPFSIAVLPNGRYRAYVNAWGKGANDRLYHSSLEVKEPLIVNANR